LVMLNSLANSPTPRSLGYAMPAEWAPHRGTWLSWPHNRETWPTQLERVKEVWLQLIGALSLSERVFLLVNDEATEKEVITRLKKSGVELDRVSILQIRTVDVWMRDYGPSFLTRNLPDAPLAINDWIFNGWGAKYKSYEEDDRVAKEIAARLRLPVFEHPIVLEGGSIEVNGAGICMTTEQCLLNRNRNPAMTRKEIERYLMDALGVEYVIWLGNGLAGDDTDGHIDDIARFVSPSTIVCVSETSPGDENYAALRQNYERLEGARDPGGHRYSIVGLPCPRPIYHDHCRLPASYANFYIANEIVAVPVFDDPNDGTALGILKELFPGRKVLGLPCKDMIAGLGAIHCVTQQEPNILRPES